MTFITLNTSEDLLSTKICRNSTSSNLYSYKSNSGDRYLITGDKYNNTEKYLKNAVIYGIPETYGGTGNSNILTNEGLLVVKISEGIYHIYDLYGVTDYSSDISNLNFVNNITKEHDSEKFEKILVLHKYDNVYKYIPECIGEYNGVYLYRSFIDYIVNTEYSDDNEYRKLGYELYPGYSVNSGTGAQYLGFNFKFAYLIKTEPNLTLNFRKDKDMTDNILFTVSTTGEYQLVYLGYTGNIKNDVKYGFNIQILANTDSPNEIEFRIR